MKINNQNLHLLKPLGSAAIVGFAAYATKAVTLNTALAVGGTFSLVSQVTKPFFEVGGIIPFICNAALTTGLVNLAGYSLTVVKTAHITLLPTIVALKIIALSVIILSIFSMINYLTNSSILSQ